MKLYITILSLLVTVYFSRYVEAKVKAPNYNFSVDSFLPYMPGQNIKNLITKEKPQLIRNGKKFKTYKFYIEHIRYKFALLVQTKNDTVTDFHARLPQYFLHDVFHQSLINRYGIQDIYKKTEESALYTWKDKNNINIVYSGTCTITCFPIFYSTSTTKHDFGGDYKKVTDKLVANEF